MGKISENNPLFTTKLHFVENFLRFTRSKGYTLFYKSIDFIEFELKKLLVVKSGKKCKLVEK